MEEDVSDPLKDFYLHWFLKLNFQSLKIGRILKFLILVYIDHNVYTIEFWKINDIT